MLKTSKQHTMGLIMLSLTAIFWGAGFVLSEQLLHPYFANTPSMLNAIRFVVATLCLLVVFNKKIRVNKQILLCGCVGGVLLFVGFLTQLIGLKYTTPSHSGFFTAAYIIFVPFISWIIYKKCPKWIMFVGVGVAVTGLIVLNINVGENASNTWMGDALTIISALMFALQIFWADFVLKKEKTDFVQLTFWQVAIAAILFVLYSLIVEGKYYASFAQSFDFSFCWWRLAIVTLGGTAFAYYAQTFAQRHLTATETSLIMACESPIGAFLSMILLIEAFSWKTVVGGLLVLIAVVLVEVVPTIHCKIRKKTTPSAHFNDVTTTEQTENTIETEQ